MVSIEVLNDDVLLAIFDFYVGAREDQKEKQSIEAWQTLVHVSAVARRCICITTTPGSATCLYGENVCEGHFGCLASVTGCHRRRYYHKGCG